MYELLHHALHLQETLHLYDWYLISGCIMYVETKYQSVWWVCCDKWGVECRIMRATFVLCKHSHIFICLHICIYTYIYMHISCISRRIAFIWSRAFSRNTKCPWCCETHSASWQCTRWQFISHVGTQSWDFVALQKLHFANHTVHLRECPLQYGSRVSIWVTIWVTK